MPVAKFTGSSTEAIFVLHRVLFSDIVVSKSYSYVIHTGGRLKLKL